MRGAITLVLLTGAVAGACGIGKLDGLTGGSGAALGAAGTAGDAVVGGRGNVVTGGAAGGGIGGALAGASGASAAGMGGGSAGASGASAGSGGESGGVAVKAVPELYWKFDETSGTAATDSTGNALHGSYATDVGTLPSPAVGIVPGGLSSWDPASLSFEWGQYVEVTPLNPNFALIKRTNDFTISVWYQSTVSNIGSIGSELVSLGDHYGLRLTTARIEWNKRWITSSTNMWVQYWCTPLAPYLDGNWHHIAAVQSKTDGMQIYLDGNLLDVRECYFNNYPDQATTDVLYEGGGTNFRVGRHGNTSRSFDFQGNLDDVRVYGQVLSHAQIVAIYQGVDTAL